MKSTLENEMTIRKFEGRGWLSDPCYADSDNVECGSTYRWAGVDLGEITGTWEFEAVRGEEDRCFRFIACKIDGEAAKAETTRHNVGVDAGLMGIFSESDAGYDWSSCCDEIFNDGNFDDGSILYPVTYFVASTTGWGDGSYPARVERDSDGNAIRVEVDFSDEPWT